MFGVYAIEYERRKREMDSPLWEAERKAYLEKYFYLWPEIEKMKENESIMFYSWTKKETYPDHFPRMTPDLDALFDFLVFLGKNTTMEHKFVYHEERWGVCLFY
jgi:hypothetical protein